MRDPHGFLTTLALVLCVAAVTTVVFQRLRQPIVLGTIMAGVLIGPYVSPLWLPGSARLVADRQIIETLAELGVILVMFSLGLEFSLRRLLRRGAGVALVAIIEVSVMMWLGFMMARLFGWSTATAVLTAAAVSISSTTIIAKTFDEIKVPGRLRDLVFAVLIFEDLIAIVLLATLPTVITGQSSAWKTLADTSVRLGAFIAVLLVFGMLVVPRVMRFVVRLGRAETTLVASIGLCFAIAVLVRSFGYSVALGAFFAGSLVAESGTAPRVEALVRPVRDMFSAIFFVSVGMLIDPTLVAAHLGAVLALSAVVVVGKIFAVTSAAFLAGNGTGAAVQTGMSMAQIGEFSFILTGMGLSLGVVAPFLFPVVVAVSVITTLLTPYLVRWSVPAAARLAENLPAALQTFTALYGTWIERMRGSSDSAPASASRFARARRLVLYLLLDVFVLTAVIISASLTFPALFSFAQATFGLAPAPARALVVIAAVAAAGPFALGVIRLARGLGRELAEIALPSSQDGQLDLAAAPRRALIVTLQLAVVLLVGMPLLAVTQPFLPPFQGAVILFLSIALLGIGFWRSANNLQGHVRAGAQMVVELLAKQGSEAPHGAHQTGAHQIGPPALDPLAHVDATLPGLGAPSSVIVAPGSPAVGRTLADINLRGLTGATVLAITRPGGSVLIPTGQEKLQAGDTLAVAGTRDCVAAARALIAGVAPGGAPPV